MTVPTIILAATLLSAVSQQAWAQQPRTLTPYDIYRTKSVHDPQLSPDGTWIAYTVTTADSGAASRNRV